MSDRLARLEKLNKDIKKQQSKKSKGKNNRYNDDMDIESEGSQLNEDEEDFIDDAQDKKKYREYEDEYDQEIEEEEEQNTKKKTKNTILNYTNTTAISSNKKKVINKQVEDIDIEEIMLLAERKKKIQQEEAQILKEEQQLQEQEEEEERLRVKEQVSQILKDDSTTSKTSSKGKVDISVLNAMNRDLSEDSNTVDSILEVQNMISLAKKAKEANEKLKEQQTIRQAQNPEINLTNLSITQMKNIKDYMNEDGSLDAYVYDFYQDAILKPGKIYAFAKVQNKRTKTFDSCTIQIDNIIRNLFFYPTSDNVTEQQINKEIKELLVKEQSGRKVIEVVGAFVEKNYAFELPIPKGKGKWYQAVLSYEYETLSPDVKGQYFTHCVGTTYSALETFLITKKVRGPSWVRFEDVKDTTSMITNKKLEIRVDYAVQSNITVLDQQLAIPPLRIACISLKTSQQIVLTQKKKEYRKEIFTISLKYHEGINIDIANQAELNDFKSLTFITHINPSKKQDTIASKGNLADTTKFCISELNLLEQFLIAFNDIDPDIVVAHDLYSNVFEVLLTRMREKGIKKWNLLSKLINIGSSEIPKFGSAVNKARSTLKGRLIIDTLISAQEFVNSVEYTIESLALKLFKAEISRIDPKTYEQKFVTYRTLNSLIEDTYLEVDQTLKIMYHLQLIPLTKQLTQICGNLWIGSLQNQRAERNEMLLLHKFNQLNYVYPDNFKNLPQAFKRKQKNVQMRKQYENEDDDVQVAQNRPAKKRENKYKGGQVFEPIKGLYNEYIVLLDFNSLYPSIIQEFNVCFTTCIRNPIPLETQMAPFLGNKNQPAQKTALKNNMEEEDEAEEQYDAEHIITAQDVLPVIEEVKFTAPLPSILKYLVDQRKVVKNQLKGVKDPKIIETLDIKQKAFKLVANSMYGCLGFSSSRFYAMPLASFITAKGRLILFDSKRVVEDLNHQVVYGDTDSLMVRPGTNDLLEAVKVGYSIKMNVNKKYKKLQLDIDGVFKNMLLLKKKKYATLKVTNWEEAYQNPQAQEKLEKEVKGIDVVRRDWCQLSRDAGNRVLEIILESINSEIMVDNIKKYLTDLNDEINNKNIKNSSYYITKRLTKRIDQYGEKNLPHVAVAARIIEEKNIDPQTYVNQIINYLICKNDSSRLSDKAFSPSEFINKNRNLEIDYIYYKRFQLFEPIKRLLEVVENINISEIANILEINYTVTSASVKSEFTADTLLNLRSKRNQFLQWLPLILIDCKQCGQEFPYQGILLENIEAACILKCTNASCKADISNQVKNKIDIVIKRLINRYEEFMIQQDEDEYDFTHSISITEKTKILQISNYKLNQQLLAIQALFTLSKQEDDNMLAIIKDKINTLKNYVDVILSKSEYNNLDLSILFKNFGISK